MGTIIQRINKITRRVMKHLSIIIPVYNVAPYVEACLKSIYKQGLEEEEFEVILINDGSTDNSLQIITDIEKVHTNITIVTQKNQGLSISRNQGIARATGEFILFVDADDLLIPNTLSYFLQCAQLYDTDMIQGEFIKLNNKEIEKFDISSIPFPNISKISNLVKNGERAFIENYQAQESYSVIYLYKREFIIKNTLSFPEHKYFEDIPFTVTGILKAKRFLSLPILFYIYRQRENSIMSTIDITKLYSMNDIIQYLYSLLDEKTLSPKTRTRLKDGIFANFSVDLWYLSHYRQLYPHRNEIIADLKRKIPNIYFQNTYRQRFISFCFKYIPSLYITARYYSTRNKY